jgi:hypothetical protein
MKAVLTLTLTTSLIASSLPAAAQFPYMPTPRYQSPTQYPPPPAPVSSDWTRVRAIEPRSRIRVTAVGLGDRDHQYFVSASDRAMTLLVVGGLPRTAKRLVLNLAGSHPELFVSPDKWAEYRDGKVRVNPDGLFIGNRKIADLSEIAKTVDAGDVAEVSAEVVIPRAPHDIDQLSPVVGGAFVAGLYGTLAICKDKCGSAALLPILGAPIAAALILARRTPRAMAVVYRVR